jgi:hypothetical protein
MLQKQIIRRIFRHHTMQNILVNSFFNKKLTKIMMLQLGAK